MNKIKYLLIIILYSVSLTMSGETTLNIQGIKINGEKINAYEVFFLNDYCMFSITDNKGEQAEILSSRWEFRCCGNETDFIEKIIENESCFSFSLDDINSNPELLKRINSDQDSSVYFESYIKASGLLKNGEEFDLSFPIYLNLLPSIPYYEIIDYYKNGYYITINIVCKAERSEYLRFILREYDPPRIYTNSCNIENTDLHTFEVDSQFSADFIIGGRNKYGWTLGNHAIIPEYIYNSINETVSDNLISIFPNPFKDEINIGIDQDQIRSLVIYDIKGSAIKKNYIIENKKINLEELNPGIYFLYIDLYENLSSQTYKIIKN